MMTASAATPGQTFKAPDFGAFVFNLLPHALDARADVRRAPVFF
jgi:hypothetical protein